MINVETILPEAPAGHFWRLSQNDDSLLLDLRYGNAKESKGIYSCPVTSSVNGRENLDSLLESTARFILKHAYPPKADWSDIVGDYGL